MAEIEMADESLRVIKRLGSSNTYMNTIASIKTRNLLLFLLFKLLIQKSLQCSKSTKNLC